MQVWGPGQVTGRAAGAELTVAEEAELRLKQGAGAEAMGTCSPSPVRGHQPWGESGQWAPLRGPESRRKHF